MIKDGIQHYPYSLLMSQHDHFFEQLSIAKVRINLIIVLCIILMVGRRLKKRIKVQSINTQFF